MLVILFLPSSEKNILSFSCGCSNLKTYFLRFFVFIDVFFFSKNLVINIIIDSKLSYCIIKNFLHLFFFDFYLFRIDFIMKFILRAYFYGVVIRSLLSKFKNVSLPIETLYLMSFKFKKFFIRDPFFVFIIKSILIL